MVKEVYPNLEDPSFALKIAKMEEYGIYEIPPMTPFKDKDAFEKKANQLCQFEKTYYQHFVSQYISKRSPYRSLLIYHALGSGKSCSAITIAEAFNQDQRLYDEPNIWIISRKALKGSFEQEIFRTLYLFSQDKDLRDQCTGDAYYRQIPNASQLPRDVLLKRLHKMIQSKYQFFGYDQFANIIEKYKSEGTLAKFVQNKVIIIDEAHNLRNLEFVGEHKKKIVEPLMDVLEQGRNNRLVLLSATPMYNEAEEMLWLLSLLLLNDHRKKILDPLNLPQFYTKSGKPNVKLFHLCKQLSQTYVSYIKGQNPFTFATRLTPPEDEVSFLKTIPSLSLTNEPIPKYEQNWLEFIKDGLVTSSLGRVQLEALAHYDKKHKKPSTATLRQLQICAYKKHLGKEKYDYQEGKDGLTAVLRRVDELEPVQYVYSKKDEPIFDPAFPHLQEHACKLATLAKLLSSSKGIVVIYTMFVWGGVVPTALMLEHLGFSRYKERDFLKMENKATQPVKYPGIVKPAYCILSGETDKEIMGSTHIDDLLKDINAPENQNGEKIKVVVISPVAGEGLSFKNIREMHILDPWYHLNNQEQAIGRAIRNCSHSSLPIEQRNVTVFLHTTVYPDNHKETSDLHAYRLASIKYQHIQEVDHIIQENALDCGLMKHINYFPKSLFPFKVILKTSRGRQVPYQYGDLPEDEIQCIQKDTLPQDTRSFRYESYQSFIPTLQQKLRKLLEKNYKEQSINSYTYEELIASIHPNRELATKVLEATLLPYPLWGKMVLLYHHHQFIVGTLDTSLPSAKRLQWSEEEKVAMVEPTICSLMQIFEPLQEETIPIATLKIFQALDSDCWRPFAEQIIQTPTANLSPKLSKALGILEAQGAFILKKELSMETPSAYVGYVNLFSDESTFEVIVWDEDGYREATASELSRIKKQRVHHEFTNPMKMKIVDTIGIFQRYKNPKDPKSPYRFQFKLGLNNEKGKRSGVVCDAGLKKPQIETELMKYTKKEVKGNVSQLCFQLMYELFKDGKIWMPALYKPK
jgi:hypothetical protein